MDEAGRGALAGPVVVAAVVLTDSLAQELRRDFKLRDSKKMTARQRDRAFLKIQEEASGVAVAFRSADRIDTVNIRNATLEAMAETAHTLHKEKPLTRVLIDGDAIPGDMPPVKTTAVIKGDSIHACIAAASVVAKVTRDRHMAALEDKRYGFARHKGYGTAAHYDALREFGPSAVHRRSFRLA